MGNPLTVELLIPLGMKDYWNRSGPANDAQFAPLIADPFFVSAVLKGVYGLNVPPAPRNDLLSVYRSGYHAHRSDYPGNSHRAAEPPGTAGRR